MGRRSEGYKLNQRNGIWHVCWSENRIAYRRTTGERDRKEAERFLAAFILERDKPPAPPEHLYTIKECLNHYYTEHGQHTASKNTILYHIAHLSGILGDLTASAIYPAKITEYTQKRKEKGLSDGSIKRELSTLTAALNHAFKERRLTNRQHIPKPKSPPARDKWLTRQDAAKLIRAARTQHIKLFIMLALYTGQRKGAILDLDWSQVDMKNRLIDFNPKGRTQTSKKRSEVPINDALYAALKKIKKSMRHGAVVKYRGRGKDGKLADIKTGFKLAREAAGLPKGITPHTLRHTCGTWLAQAGADMWRISAILGHSHSRTTELYLKHHPDYLRDTVALLDAGKQLANKTSKNRKK